MNEALCKRRHSQSSLIKVKLGWFGKRRSAKPWRRKRKILEKKNVAQVDLRSVVLRWEVWRERKDFCRAKWFSICFVNLFSNDRRRSTTFSCSNWRWSNRSRRSAIDLVCRPNPETLSAKNKSSIEKFQREKLELDFLLEPDATNSNFPIKRVVRWDSSDANDLNERRRRVWPRWRSICWCCRSVSIPRKEFGRHRSLLLRTVFPRR